MAVTAAGNVGSPAADASRLTNQQAVRVQTFRAVQTAGTGCSCCVAR